MSFDQPIDRSQFPTLKCSKALLEEHFGSDDVLPLWVADMDFRAPQVVVDSLRERVEHGIFGYEYRRDSYTDALLNWYATRHGWSIDRDHIEQCPSILSAVAILIEQHTEKGDGIIVQPPVFFEFRMVLRSNGRKMVKNPLQIVDGRYQMDLADLEAKAADPATKMLILCNPHNPVGRVWTRDELTQAGEICARHDVFVVSDEIHGDIVLPGFRYTPFTSISSDMAQRAATCLSPGKTFNLSGVVDALAVIANKEHRDRFRDFCHRYQVNRNNVFASAAVEAAYGEGEQWLDAVLAHLQSNVDYLRSYLGERLPQVRLTEPEGTFLVWLDFRELGLGAKELARFLAEKARLALNAGYWFGREGAGFARMNIACSRSTLQEAMVRLSRAIHGES